MRNGLCPKCRSRNVYVKENGVKIGEYSGVYVYTSMITKSSPLESYICADCGYFENFIADPAKLMEVTLTWTKVAPSTSALDLDDL